ncbi:uncharacterized protein LOC120354583 [Nilaparvata lugens]|uniref:uncharacterized protein LOC120354583 n=1 Tax=Nilaparvata lugens TaxID=108931 RepID=UPI00193D32DA|nr:uncharacterized protein LOC120354583 [Nilaparvata lugens]
MGSALHFGWMQVVDRSPIIPSRNTTADQIHPAGGQKNKFMSTVKRWAREERDVSIPTIFADEEIRHRDAAVRLSRSTVLRTMARSRRAIQPKTPQSIKEMRASLQEHRFANLCRTRDGQSDFFVAEVGKDLKEV